MNRSGRADEKEAIYHALNRCNRPWTIFHKATDYEAFENILSKGLQIFPWQIVANQSTPNHRHLVL
ncbi:hypothetical protein SH528x_002960 [Novipirellula sp. SH528]|uniref:hypothetical protein n=1 Tax=Novipirellula sp. SH528 TaxID=3454466 RepID=UPI003F9FD744